MVGVVKEYSIIGGGSEDSSCSFSTDCGSISSQDRQIVGSSGIVTLVIDDASFIVINSWSGGWLVVQGVGVWVVWAFCNIIVAEDDDLVSIEFSIVDQHVVSVADIGLVAIVSESVGSCDQDGVVCCVSGE